MAFDGNQDFDYDSNSSESHIAEITENLSEYSTLATTSDHIDTETLDDIHSEDDALQTANNLDDSQYTEESTSSEPTDTVQETADSSEEPQDTDADSFDNPLVDSDSLVLNSVGDEPENLTTDSAPLNEAHGETEENSLTTLLGSNSDDGTVHETETISGESNHNSNSNESGQETTIISQDAPLSFGDIINEGDNKDISNLIPTTETTETAQTPNNVEHVPAEGGDADGSQTWASNEPDDLIAKPEVEA